MIKHCIQCTKEVNIKPYREKTFKYCSKECKHLGMVGLTPWNKGIKTGIKTPTQFRKGDTPWNKGMAQYKNCKDCGKKSYWIRKTDYCHKCWIKNWDNKSQHPRWKADRSSLVKSEKKHLDGLYRGWMINVKRRDKFTCKINNKDCSGRLESHHILNWVDYPELRYEINNGITLCHGHHPQSRKLEQELAPIFKALVKG